MQGSKSAKGTSLANVAVMRAMVMDRPGGRLHEVEQQIPQLRPDEVLVKVDACAVCRTDLHIIDGELTPPRWPVVPGHEVVGRVVAIGSHVRFPRVGSRVGVAWLGSACGQCEYCRRGQENLCPEAEFTGFSRPGGFAEYLPARADYVFPLPDGNDATMAPLLCAGLIGFRAWRMAGDGDRVGLYGFGAAAHILAQILAARSKKIYAFTRPGDRRSQQFALQLGAVWAGDSTETPPDPLDAALIFAPVGALVPLALSAVRPGGTVVCGGIHMSDIPAFPYKKLWEERAIRSVANLTREDGRQFFTEIQRFPVKTETHCYPLVNAVKALEDLRHGRFQGAAVLCP